MKKISLLIAFVIALVACNKKPSPDSSPNDVQSTQKKTSLVHQLRVLNNDLLVGEYDASSNTISIVNLSTFLGTTFEDIESPANTYTVNSVSISHNSYNQFYIEYTGVSLVGENIRVGLPLYVGTRENPDVNFLNCPKETHSCKGNNCECCRFVKTNGCITGCTCNQVVSNPIGDQCEGTGGTCDHTVTTSEKYSDQLADEADNAAS